MRRLRATLLRLVGLFRRRSIDAEIRDEFEGHIAGLTERNMAAGMTSEVARAAAVREFGGVAQLVERSRDQRRSLWAEQLYQDLTYALHSLRKTPSFTLTAVVTLALGIGVNTGLFSVFNMVALRSPAVKDPDTLVRIDGCTSRGSINRHFSFAEFMHYREGARSLDGVIAFDSTWCSLSAGPDGQSAASFTSPAQQVAIESVSDNYFNVLGARMALGRIFSPDEAKAPGAAPVIVLSHAFWHRHFLSDPNVIGSTLLLDKHVVTVIGVAAWGFSGQESLPPAGWLPIGCLNNPPEDYTPQGVPRFNLIGRLKPGIDPDTAKADLDTVASRWAAEFPGPNAKHSVRLERGLAFLRFNRSAQGLVALSTIFLGFGLVLAVACTNVANLLLARGVSRQTEIGIRLTLGASRGRILRQLLTENIVLSTIGGVVGLLLSWWTLHLAMPYVAQHLQLDWAGDTRQIPLFSHSPDFRVFGFTALLTAGATLMAGFLPALHAADGNLIAAVRNDGTAFGGKFPPSRLRRLLVISQVALCVTLLSGAGVLVRSFVSAQKVDVGFDAHAVFGVSLTPNGTSRDAATTFRQALDTLRTNPGVVNAAVAHRAPLLGSAARPRIRKPGTLGDSMGEPTPATFVSSGFFETFGIALRAGRGFGELEQTSAAHVLLVSESLARRLWPDQNAIGQTLAVSEDAWIKGEKSPRTERFRECEVIGVARDVVIEEMVRYKEDQRHLVYLPYALDVRGRGSVHIRPRSDSAAALAEIVRSADAAGVGVRIQQRHSHWVDQIVLTLYGLSSLSWALGFLATIMAGVGLYGVIAFGVNQRVREIGVRMALGASHENIVTLFVQQGMLLVLVGLGLGLVGGALLALALERILFGLVHAFDPLAFGGVTVIFCIVAFFACWLPARRAARVDPMVALRAE